MIGPHCLKFDCRKPGRPSRLSRAFGVDGRKYEAIVIGLWLKLDQIQAGERIGEQPGLIIDFLGDQLRQTTRGALGPWTSKEFPGLGHWSRVAKRIPVPPGTRDAIMSVGLLGATGVLDVDGLTIDLIPVGGKETTNLVKNPDFELGDPEPDGWISDDGAPQRFPGHRSPAAAGADRVGRAAMTGLAIPVEGFDALELSVAGQGARACGGGGGAMAGFFFLDEDGKIDPGATGGVVARSPGRARSTGERDRVIVPVPAGCGPRGPPVRQARRPRLDQVRRRLRDRLARPRRRRLDPVPRQRRHRRLAPDLGFVDGDRGEVGARLLVPARRPGGQARVRHGEQGGRLAFAQGGRARFFGVHLLPPTAFLETERADALADRLARSGVNLVRLGDLDTPLGPDRSLFDDTRDDTKVFDENALARLDHLTAALKARGIYVAIELQGARRFRSEDGVAMPGALPPGGGPPAVFDPVITKLADESARALLSHVNPETGLAYKNDPALAWVTLSGEVSLFNRLDDPSPLPGDYEKAFKELAAKSKLGAAGGSGRHLDAGRTGKAWPTRLRKDGLKAPDRGRLVLAAGPRIL